MSKEIYFYRFLVNSQVFFCSKFTYALVNLKPLVPGHVLVVPYRTSVLRFADLTTDESIDYMNTLQLVHKFIINVYKADALNIAIQDGPESGQSIPHLHTHLIPRYKSDTWGDDIYQKIQDIDLEALYDQFHMRKAAFQKNPVNELALPDERRHIRTPLEMETEANWLKLELEKFYRNQ